MKKPKLVTSQLGKVRVIDYAIPEFNISPIFLSTIIIFSLLD